MIDLRELARVCVTASIASQTYVHRHILGGGAALRVDVKGVLGHKEGEFANDLVTDADRAVQELIVWALRTKLADGSELTIVGEEDDPSSPSDTAVIANFETVWSEAVLTARSPVFLDPPVVSLFSDERTETSLRFAADVRRIAVFIDPIDGTNGFVDGIYHVPMNLVGIAVDGIPVGGVANRVFVTEPAGRSLSFCLENCAFVIDGVVQTGSASALDSTLRVTVSQTTKKSALDHVLRVTDSLGMIRIEDRGAGNKLMKLVDSVVLDADKLGGTVAGSDATASAALAQAAMSAADVFIALPGSIKKWDTCAPHAFIRMRGGDVYDWQFVPIRYDEKCTDEHSGVATALDRGVIAIRGGRAEVRQLLIQNGIFDQ